MSHTDTNSVENMFVRHAKAFGDIHCHAGSLAFAPNLDTCVELLHVDNMVMPATINRGEPGNGNSWVCSPLTTYCDYAIEELQRYLHPLLSRPLTLICRAYGYALERAHIDQAVAVNNWMLSTNLYPALQTTALGKMIDSVVQRWPDHAVWFRSLNAEHNADWLNALRARGFELIPSRQVFYKQLSVYFAKATSSRRR